MGKGDPVTQLGSARTSESAPCCPDPHQGLEVGGTAPTAPEPTSTSPCRRWSPHGGSCPTYLQIENAVDRDGKELAAALQPHDGLQGAVAKGDRGGA